MAISIQTVRHQGLSLWQSAVGRTVRDELEANNPSSTLHDVLAHPMMQAANAHVVADHKNLPIPDQPDRTSTDHHPAISKLRYDMAEAKRTGNTKQYNWLLQKCRPYATCQLIHWAKCEAIYLESWLKHGGHPIYYDWDKQLVDGKPNKDFSVIEWKLPNDGKVAILGDWGTGMDDVKAMLEQVMADHAPSAIVHLGDIYYSGTADEAQKNFVDIFNEVFGNGARVPVFNIPGNHDYYAFGEGFYNTLRQINPLSQPGVSQEEARTWQQAASYFCLRTEDGLWQLLGMDTSYNDHNPLFQNKAPSLRSSEITWHQDKLDNFDGRTILFSHHQFFSANAKISSDPKNYNHALYKVFQPYFDKIAAWFWGHEHNLAAYQNGLLGLAKGRLVGCSAYEESVHEDPYKVNYPSVPYQKIEGKDLRVNREPNTGYFNHGYAVIDLQRKNPSDPISVSYYQIPSWSGTTRIPLPPEQPACLGQETLG